MIPVTCKNVHNVFGTSLFLHMTVGILSDCMCLFVLLFFVNYYLVFHGVTSSKCLISVLVVEIVNSHSVVIISTLCRFL
jgi:hypothetical protein